MSGSHPRATRSRSRAPRTRRPNLALTTCQQARAGVERESSPPKHYKDLGTLSAQTYAKSCVSKKETNKWLHQHAPTSASTFARDKWVWCRPSPPHRPKISEVTGGSTLDVPGTCLMRPTSRPWNRIGHTQAPLCATRPKRKGSGREVQRRHFALRRQSAGCCGIAGQKGVRDVDRWHDRLPVASHGSACRNWISRSGTL